MERQRGTWMSLSLWVALAIHEMRKQNILIYLFLLRNHSLDAPCWVHKPNLRRKESRTWIGVRLTPLFACVHSKATRCSTRVASSGSWGRLVDKSMVRIVSVSTCLSFDIRKKSLPTWIWLLPMPFQAERWSIDPSSFKRMIWSRVSGKKKGSREKIADQDCHMSQISLTLKSEMLCLHWRYWFDFPYLPWRARARPRSSGIGMLTCSESWKSNTARRALAVILTAHHGSRSCRSGPADPSANHRRRFSEVTLFRAVIKPN